MQKRTNGRNCSNQKAGEALPLMKHLKALKTRYGLSILALAHTPKRDATMPRTVNDLQGSSMVGNSLDTAFAIGKSQQDSSLRYLKQIKQRNIHSVYGEDNVCVCRLHKPHNFLMFELLGYDDEDVHLRKRDEVDKAELEEKVKALNGMGKSLREIADELRIGKTTAHRLLNKDK